jgi:predicted MFS family arabinose efflux permease
MRVVLTLLTSLFAFGGFLMVYTYAGAVLFHVTHGDERILAGMLLIWGIAATVGNLLAGRLVDRFNSRTIINTGLAVGTINFFVLPWSSNNIVAATIALTIWGLVGWGLIVPQQHRLVKIAPQIAPLLLALNNTATYTGLACAGVLGGTILLFVQPQFLSIIGAQLVLIALILAEVVHRRSRGRNEA